MKKLIISSLIILVWSFSSCIAYHSGAMSPSVALTTNNFRYISTNIKGFSQATYILGFGGMNKYSLVAEAKENMLSLNPLKSNQAIVNTTVNFKQSYFFGFIVVTTVCVVTADVVEFGSSVFNFADDLGTHEDVYDNNIAFNDINIPVFEFNQIVADGLIADEKEIYLHKTEINRDVIMYSKFSDIVVGDIVCFVDRFEEIQFGIVSFLVSTKNKVGVKYYNLEHIEGNLLLSFEEILKVN